MRAGLRVESQRGHWGEAGGEALSAQWAPKHGEPFPCSLPAESDPHLRVSLRGRSIAPRTRTRPAQSSSHGIHLPQARLTLQHRPVFRSRRGQVARIAAARRQRPLPRSARCRLPDRIQVLHPAHRTTDYRTSGARGSLQTSAHSPQRALRPSFAPLQGSLRRCFIQAPASHRRIQEDGERRDRWCAIDRLPSLLARWRSRSPGAKADAR
jgi:hypothetical protein